MNWATSAAVNVYEMLATTIRPDLSVSSLPMKGAHFVRNEMMGLCQTCFQQMMSELHWNRGLINFFGQLCTKGKITSTTPSITFHILENMRSSASLTTNDNFDLSMSFLMFPRPYLETKSGLEST
jgi:hypothetical protein